MAARELFFLYLLMMLLLTKARCSMDSAVFRAKLPAQIQPNASK